MATKIKVRLIIELASAGLSRNKIALSRNMGKNSVGDVLRIAKEKGLTAELIKDFSDDEVYQLIFPQKYQVEHLYEKPDYDYVHSELKKTGVTLKLLWNEYKDTCLKQKFCCSWLHKILHRLFYFHDLKQINKKLHSKNWRSYTSRLVWKNNGHNKQTYWGTY